MEDFLNHIKTQFRFRENLGFGPFQKEQLLYEFYVRASNRVVKIQFFYEAGLNHSVIDFSIGGFNILKLLPYTKASAATAENIEHYYTNFELYLHNNSVHRNPQSLRFEDQIRVHQPFLNALKALLAGNTNLLTNGLIYEGIMANFNKEIAAKEAARTAEILSTFDRFFPHLEIFSNKERLQKEFQTKQLFIETDKFSMEVWDYAQFEDFMKSFAHNEAFTNGEVYFKFEDKKK